jgi:hypothetical protein
LESLASILLPDIQLIVAVSASINGLMLL